jgi:hypothetical protein
MPNKFSILAVSVLALGCTTQPAYQVIGRSNMTNSDGHVVGYMQTMRDAQGSETVAQTFLYLPRINKQGEVVGYEERVPGGSILRDVHGRAIGERWVDMRSRGSNPGNSGLAIIFLQ